MDPAGAAAARDTTIAAALAGSTQGRVRVDEADESSLFGESLPFSLWLIEED